MLFRSALLQCSLAPLECHIEDDSALHAGHADCGQQTLLLIALLYTGYARFNHGVDFFPNVEPDSAQVLGRARGDFSAQETDAILRRVEQRLGWPVNAHLFRHISAKLYLDRRPGEYGVVSRVLNHQSVTTTMRAYTGAEIASAVSHFQSVVADLRGEVTKRRRVAR